MKLNYNWDKYPELVDILANIYNNSEIELKKKGYQAKYAEEFINNIEDLLKYYQERHYDLTKFINALKEVDSISFIHLILLNPNKNISGNFKTIPPVSNKDREILISPFLKNDEYLSSKERRRIYLYHAILQRVISLQNERTKEFSKMFKFPIEEPIFKGRDGNIELLVNNGWLLIEEVIAQSEAENITYKILNKERPKATMGTDEFDISDYKHGIFSQLELYRMYEPILVVFGLAISDVGTMMNHDSMSIKIKIIRKALTQNLSKEVINEYLTKGKPEELYKVLYAMGILINEKYSTYGYRFAHQVSLRETEANTIYQNIIDILERNTTLDQKRYLEDLPIQVEEKDIKSKSKIRSLRYKNNYHN